MSDFYQFEAKAITGEAKPLADYKGQVLLVVNVASKCGLTPQYAGLQELYERYGAHGFSVLGFPCNQFAGQEPGSEAEIQTFCSTQYDVSFPLFAKVDVNGEHRHPLYAWLTEQASSPDGPGDIQWNFAKFLIGKNGEVLARFAPTTAPTAPELEAALQAALT